ncbi:hypothetical protein EYZ11_002266 [Aspergillus tanneri]|nr:hypothetical protein EYZ11_002266 [Aspergillus tanneri]
MTSTTLDPIREYGFTAVPSAAEKVVDPAFQLHGPPPVAPVSMTPVPNTPVARRIQAYAREHLPAPTFNHSMRVYHYGLAMKYYYFRDWKFSDETYLLACMLHDIGATQQNLRATHLSFEFYGGLLALDVLQRPVDEHGSPNGDPQSVSPKAQAEGVAEAVIRHQDLCKVGSITALGQLIQLATILDNTGVHSQLVHPDTARDVIQHYPRLQWSDCFANTVREENRRKPWAHTTTLGEEDFPDSILGNAHAAPYEQNE